MRRGKPLVRGKVARRSRAGILGYQIAHREAALNGGDGIVGEDVEETIANVGRLAKQGMYQTDRTILQIMTGK